MTTSIDGRPTLMGAAQAVANQLRTQGRFRPIVVGLLRWCDPRVVADYLRVARPIELPSVLASSRDLAVAPYDAPPGVDLDDLMIQLVADQRVAVGKTDRASGERVRHATLARVR